MVDVAVESDGLSKLREKINAFEKGIRRLSTGAAIGEIASKAARARLRTSNKTNPLASWAPLSEAYRKRVKEGSILLRTESMYHATGYSLTQWASQGWVVLYSGMEYAKYHQDGKGKMKRPFLGLSVKDKNDIANAIDQLISKELQ